MPTAKDKMFSIIIMIGLALYYGYFAFIVLTKTDLKGFGVAFGLAALVALCASIGIHKNNKVLLYLGIILTFILILDGISSIINKFGFKEDILIGRNLFIAALCLLPISVMRKLVRTTKAS